MITYIRFYLLWILANLIGFVFGSHLGATNDGLIPFAIPGFPGLIIGDLIFGASFGLAQWLVFHFTHFVRVSPSWIGLTSLGFTAGARFGSLITYRLADLHILLEPSLVFGIIMGVSIGISTYLAFRHIPFGKHLVLWLSVIIIAWVTGEGIAFNSHFSQATVPQVALAIGGITGLGLIYIQYRLSMQNKMTDIEVGASAK